VSIVSANDVNDTPHTWRASTLAVRFVYDRPSRTRPTGRGPTGISQIVQAGPILLLGARNVPRRSVGGGLRENSVRSRK
jgi:hypothetical protein